MTQANKITGAEIVIKALIDQGVDTVFGYPGGAILPIYDELFQQKKSNIFLLDMSKQLHMLRKVTQDLLGKLVWFLLPLGPVLQIQLQGLRMPLWIACQ